MSELYAVYEENCCAAKIGKNEEKKDKEPYLILNMEKCLKLLGKGENEPHCDFVYVSFKDGKFEIFIVELKNVKSDKVKGPLESIKDKFHTTLNLLGKHNLLEALGIKRNFSKKYGVVVLPEEKIEVVRSLIRHGRIHIGGLKNYDRAWIAPCGGYIRDMRVILK